MIPKIIHYCWFGRGEKPELAKKCIASWEKFCPDFEIREWNEDNCDYLAMPFMAEAYAAKKYAFVSDVMRLVVLEQYGGVYFDTDVEVLRDISPLLDDEGFIGFENDQYVASGLTIAAEAHHPVIQAMIEEKKLPYVIVLNQEDKLSQEEAEKRRQQIMAKNGTVPVCNVSTVRKTGLEKLKDALIMLAPDTDLKLHILGDLVEENDVVVLVVPVDSAAPKGRLIMPQQQVIRDILDNHAVSVVTQVPSLAMTLDMLGDKVKMVITDSQAFGEVSRIVPTQIPLTSFSILFARHKGNLRTLVEGVTAVDRLRDGDRVLIAEGCTHRRQCDDIGTVKIPRWLKEYTGKELQIETCSGTGFPTDLSSYALIIHCGGCTLHEKEMKHRIFRAQQCQVPIVNYGIFIAYVKGILKRSVELFPAVWELLE